MALRELFAKFEFEWDQGTLQKISLVTQGAEQKVVALVEGINQQAAAVRSAVPAEMQYTAAAEQNALSVVNQIRLHAQLINKLDQLIGVTGGASVAEEKLGAASHAAGAGLAHAAAGTQQAAHGTGKLKDVMHQTLAAFGIFGGVFGAVFAGHAIKEAITNEIELAAELEHTATRTGMGAEALQILGMQAKQSGVPFEVLTTSLVGLTKNVGLFAAGAPSRIKGVFKALKIGVKDVKGMAPEDLFWKIGQGIASIADPTQKLAFAQRIFGESGALMLDMFKGTPAELAAAREAYAETGAVFSEAFVKQAHKAELTLIKFGTQLRRLKVALIAEVLPGVLRVVDKLLAFSKAIVGISKSSNALQGAFLAGGWMVFAKVLARLTAGGGGLWKWLAKLWPMLLSIGRVLVPWVAWALILDDIITYLQGGDSLLGRFLDHMFGAGAAADVLQTLRDGWQNLIDLVAEIGPKVKQFWTDNHEGCVAGVEAIGLLTLATMTGVGKIIARLVVAIASWGFHTAAIWASNVAAQSLWLTLLDIGIALGAFALAAASIYVMVDQFVKLKNEVGGVANLFKGLLSMFKGKGFFAGVDAGLDEQARAEAAKRGAEAAALPGGKTPAWITPNAPTAAAAIPAPYANAGSSAPMIVNDNRNVEVNVSSTGKGAAADGRVVAAAVVKAQPTHNLKATHGALVGAPNG
jgi:hypothetical protein